MPQDRHQKTRDDIAQYGCTVIHVLAEDDLPPFAYSIGIAGETGAPEVVVIGLKQPLAHSVVNEYNRRVRAAGPLRVGAFHAGFIGGFDIFLGEVPQSAYEEYFGQAIDFYGGIGFDVVQIIYPTTQGLWPWTTDAPASFRAWQPILSRNQPG